MRGTGPEQALDLPILGLRVRFLTDGAELREAVREAYAPWAALPLPAGEPVLRVRLSLRGAVAPAPPGIAVHEPRLLRLRGRSLRGAADSERGTAVCALSAAWLGDPARLAEEVLDTLLLFLLTSRDRVPLHAAAILDGDTALLLAGPSGAGKSTLALQAARAGLPVLSDDNVYLQQQPRPRVWGFPRPIHLLSGNVRGDADETALRYRGGRWKERVEHAPGPLWADHAALVLIERGERVRLEPISGEAALGALADSMAPGFHRYAGALPRAVRALVRGGAWRLTLSRDPAEGLEALRAVAAETQPA